MNIIILLFNLSIPLTFALHTSNTFETSSRSFFLGVVILEERLLNCDACYITNNSPTYQAIH
jgi:hypothetical protein